MTGTLYKITNNLNGKIYIGKTYLTIEERWRRHLSDSNREEYKNNKFYRALKKYGKEAFKIERIGDYAAGELEKAEITAIKEYGSFENGYNSTKGGDGNLLIDFDEAKIVQMYLDGYTLKEIASYYGTKTTRTISKILKSNNIEVVKSNPIHIIQYDMDYNFIRLFDSKQKAHEWLVNNYKSDIKRCTSYYYIKKAIENNGVAFGYRWGY